MLFQIDTLRWLIWLAFVTSWTVALLTPEPAVLAESVLSEEALPGSFNLAHLSCYAVMSALSGWLRVPASRRWLLLAFLSSHAFLTEFAQAFIPGRSASLADVAIDHLGILIGVVATYRWWRLH
jgi:VanZ family protein